VSDFLDERYGSKMASAFKPEYLFKSQSDAANFPL